MNDFSTDRWERLTELWRNKDTDSDKDAHPLNTEDKRQFELLFKIRQAMQGVQCRQYDIERGWRKVKPRGVFRRIESIKRFVAVIVIGVGVAAGVWMWQERALDKKDLVLTSFVPGVAHAELILANGERLQVNAREEVYASKTEGVVITNDTAKTRVRYQVTERAVVKRPGMNTFVVPKGGEYTLELSDGTLVWMNAESSLRFPEEFTRDKREVYLDGEAYFQVAKDSLKPFLVHVDKYCIRVLGTSFNVSAYSGDKTWYTTLVEGAIAVGGIGNEIRMSPCEQLCIDTDSGQCELREVNPELYTSWVGGKFYFKAYTFEELVRRLQRWYDFDVLYRDEGIRQRRFSGVINKYRPLGEMLEFLEMTSDVCFELNGKTIIVSKKK
ncbi:FecR family protein [Butyricimonas virosa]|uniref:FecR family protein n=3 Tax=Butyricimonas virosa TaxID=544645 RepID=A0A413IHK3_9BACT|nr:MULTISPECIES: FecR family protein [Butyricimonas]MBO4959863.1 FecR family protein [Butyricimonas sp.]MCI7162006.1 FecR family protein [Butyricimonas virosa]MCI7293189.1 FecR family protein [Butyricimonas virosa]MDY5014362.1 FecR family protein [Butyricimonas virosa]MDY5489989.1 FecR family protein [Butyricimonas virosa]